ncbi:hypothetical protein [Sinorhizobium meliloti]|nr:hypothetical protein U8C39_16870 [Sinorhizobium meliloti]WQP34156.1 hypothetical protein U8C45_16830 [Sinorhizobium meliloti]
MTGNEGANQFDGVRGGDDRWDQFRIPFLFVVVMTMKGAAARSDRHSL